MAIVVQQSVPFSSASLKLEDPTRWQALYPLLRPSTASIQPAGAQQLIIDKRRCGGNDPAIVAVPEAGLMSTELLDRGMVDAIVLGIDKGTKLSISDLRHVLSQAGLAGKRGMIIVQSSNQYQIVQQNTDATYVRTQDALQFDHLLRLLSMVNMSCRSSVTTIRDLIEEFSSTVCKTTSTFGSEKIDGHVHISSNTGSGRFTNAGQSIGQHLDSLVQKRAAATEPQVWSAHFADLNGLSRLEIYIAVGEVGKYFERHNMPFRLSQSSINDSAPNARGFAISLCPISARFLEPQSKSAAHEPTIVSSAKPVATVLRSSTMSFVDAQVRQRILHGCQAVIAAEPTITEYDTIVGDGDCGYTLRDGAKQVLKFIQDRDLADLPAVIDALVQELELSMGGTSGALYCIFLTALASSLASEPTVAQALQAALDELLKYTRARTGDRTMMDALIPFVEVLGSTSEPRQALAAAEKGVNSTKQMEAKLGRSTYLDESATQGVPDPGAYGLLILLRGMVE